MLKLNSFLNECSLKGCNMGLNVQKNKKKTPWYIGHWGVLTPWYIGHRGVSTPRYLGLFWMYSGSSFATPWYIGHQGVTTPWYIGPRGVSNPWYIGHRGVLSHKVPKSLDSPVHRTPRSFDSPVLRTLLDFQRVNFFLTQPRSQKNQNGPRTCLMGPGGAVWGKNRI